MAERADIWMNLKPGSNIALLNGLINVILENEWENKEFIATRTENIEELREKVAEYDLDRVEKLTGGAREKIIESARIYSHSDKAMIVYGLGVTEHRTGTENAMSIANLALVCGHIGRPSTGIRRFAGKTMSRPHLISVRFPQPSQDINL
ncbi:MAG: anaerobic selenocysteine-containing dehydrogenase [Desulforhopalus sp.]|jgi:anaerobic selenocysteine-containing dehydrogenase